SWMPAMAWAAAPGRASCRRTGCPASAATWAMPAPMVPAPTTATIVLGSRAAMRSFPREPGGPFFQEGGDAFRVVVPPAQLAHDAGFHRKLLLQRVRGGGVHRLARAHQCAGRRLGQLRGQP